MTSPASVHGEINVVLLQHDATGKCQQFDDMGLSNIHSGTNRHPSWLTLGHNGGTMSCCSDYAVRRGQRTFTWYSIEEKPL